MQNPDSGLLPNSSTPEAGRFLNGHTKGLAFLIVAVVLTIPFFNLGGFRTLGSHEVYAAVPARSMLETHDWIVPRIGEMPRLRKPPLAYWVIAASASIFGELNEWTARMPAAVASVALAALIGVWAGRWYGRQAGFAAALVQISCVYMITFARKAEIDMVLCLCTTSALFLVAHHAPDERTAKAFWRWTGIYALLAISWLAKFHYGTAMVLGPAVVYFVVQRRFRALWHLGNPFGLMLLIAAIVVWPYLLLQKVPGAWEVWKEQTVGRALGELGQQPFWFYFPHMLWLMLPWTPIALAAIPGSWRRAWKGRDAGERFLWVWFLTNLAIVSASSNKIEHYINSALPMFSLLTGRWLASWLNRESLFGPHSARAVSGEHQQSAMASACNPSPRRIGFAVRLALMAGALSGTAVAAVLLINRWPYLAYPLIATLSILGIGACAIIWLGTQGRKVGTCYATLTTLLACYMGVMAWIVPGRDHRASATRFAREVRQQIAKHETVSAFRMDMTSVWFYLQEPLLRVEAPETLAEELQHAQRLLVVGYRPAIETYRRLGEVKLLKTQVPLPGEAPPKHEPLVLVEIRKPKPELPSVATEMSAARY